MSSNVVFKLGCIGLIVSGAVAITLIIVQAIHWEAERTRQAMSQTADSVVEDAVDHAIEAAKEEGREIISDLGEIARAIIRDVRPSSDPSDHPHGTADDKPDGKPNGTSEVRADEPSEGASTPPLGSEGNVKARREAAPHEKWFVTELNS